CSCFRAYMLPTGTSIAIWALSVPVASMTAITTTADPAKIAQNESSVIRTATNMVSAILSTHELEPWRCPSQRYTLPTLECRSPAPQSGGGGAGWATGAGLGASATAPIVTMRLRFLRKRACRWAPIGSFALGRNGGMLSVIAVPSFPEAVETGSGQFA